MCIEVSINRKRQCDEDDGACSLKKAKQGEINHVPDHPNNHTEDSLEKERLTLVEEYMKRNKDVELLQQKMALSP